MKFLFLIKLLRQDHDHINDMIIHLNTLKYIYMLYYFRGYLHFRLRWVTHIRFTFAKKIEGLNTHRIPQDPLLTNSYVKKITPI